MDHYAPAEADVAAVVEHLRRSGFTGITVADNRLLVSADGTPGAVKAAFNTELRSHAVQGRDAYGNTTDAQVPAHLAGIVSAVHGLQTVSSWHLMNELAAPVADRGRLAVHDAFDFEKIYGAAKLPGAEESIVAIIAAGNIHDTLDDLAEFDEQEYISHDTREIDVGAKGTDTSGTLQWDIDSQAAVGAAGDWLKALHFYVATALQDAPLIEAFNKAVSDNAAQAINVSFGSCEDDAAMSGFEAGADAIFQVAVAQGQTFSVAAGDFGSFECNSPTHGQSYPASSPYVMAIGATTLTTEGATKWVEESAWSCHDRDDCQRSRGGSGGGGGGISSTEKAPGWQLQSGVLKGSSRRGLPDLSFDGNPNSGLSVYIAGDGADVGGTGLASALFAGFWTRLQSLHHNRLPFPAAGLYKYGVAPKNSANMLHDIVEGQNGDFNASLGWDYATGFGSLDIGKLAEFIDAHPDF